MALNKNHEFEEINGVKCGIVEKNAKPERVAFLKELLEYNGFEVITAPSPPPKVAAAPKPATLTEGDTQPPTSNNELQTPSIEPPPVETFTIGVSDYTFNPINAIFGRQLKTRDGHFVTLAYWNQEQSKSNDEVPYFENEKTWK
jgi:hypothetical protein